MHWYSIVWLLLFIYSSKCIKISVDSKYEIASMNVCSTVDSNVCRVMYYRPDCVLEVYEMVLLFKIYDLLTIGYTADFIIDKIVSNISNLSLRFTSKLVYNNNIREYQNNMYATLPGGNFLTNNILKNSLISKLNWIKFFLSFTCDYNEKYLTIQKVVEMDVQLKKNNNIDKIELNF